jgi:hypothetical protein
VASAGRPAAPEIPAASPEPLVARLDKDDRKKDDIGPIELRSLDAASRRSRGEDDTIGGAGPAQGAVSYGAKDRKQLDESPATIAPAREAGAKAASEELAKRGSLDQKHLTDADGFAAAQRKPAMGADAPGDAAKAERSLKSSDKVAAAADAAPLRADEAPEANGLVANLDAVEKLELRKEPEAKKSIGAAKTKTEPAAAPGAMPAAPPAAATGAAPAPVKPVTPIASVHLRVEVPAGQVPLVANLSLENGSRDALAVPRGSLILEGIDAAGTTTWRHATGLPSEAVTIAPGARQDLTLTLNGAHALPPSIVDLRLRLRQMLSDAYPLPKRE